MFEIQKEHPSDHSGSPWQEHPGSCRQQYLSATALTTNLLALSADAAIQVADKYIVWQRRAMSGALTANAQERLNTCPDSEEEAYLSLALWPLISSSFDDTVGGHDYIEADQAIHTRTIAEFGVFF